MASDHLGTWIPAFKGRCCIEIRRLEWSHDLLQPTLKCMKIAQKPVPVEFGAQYRGFDVPVVPMDRLAHPLDLEGMCSRESRRDRQFEHPCEYSPPEAADISAPMRIQANASTMR